MLRSLSPHADGLSVKVHLTHSGFSTETLETAVLHPCFALLCKKDLAIPFIPTLTTARLILRAPVEGDFSAYERLMASPRSKGMGGPCDTRTAWGIFCHDIASWSLYGHGALMVDLRATGECVGQVGINHGPLFPEKELGWLVYEAAEGFGYASEAAAALRDWAGQTLGLNKLVSYIDPENRASIKVAERLGATLDLQAPKQDPEDLVYRHIVVI